MRSVTVRVEQAPYEILIEEGLLSELDAHLADFAGRRAVVVADDHTAPLFADRVIAGLARSDIRAKLCVVPAGEESKCAEQLHRLYDAFLDVPLSREDVVFALGGGVVGDLAGYAAATYLRGVPMVQIPTTLLADVDSSVGGKVAIDLPQGKNLVGAFCQPRRVLIDPEVLSSLEIRQMRAGLAEVIKYGAILDAELFALLEEAGSLSGLMPHLSEIIERCCTLKARVVEEDPYDRGLRMILNFGHTLGHAIEQASSYALLHGEAVAIGMRAAAVLGERRGITPPGTASRLRDLLTLYHLPSDYRDHSPEELVARMALDKKATGKGVRGILLSRMGQAEVVSLTPEDLRELAEAAR